MTDRRASYCVNGRHWVEGMERNQAICPEHMPAQTRIGRALCAIRLHYTEPVPWGVMRMGGICERCGHVDYHDDIGGVLGMVAKALYALIVTAAAAALLAGLILA